MDPTTQEKNIKKSHKGVLEKIIEYFLNIKEITENILTITLWMEYLRIIN